MLQAVKLNAENQKTRKETEFGRVNLPELTIATMATEMLTLSEKLMRRLRKASNENVCRAPHPTKNTRDVFYTFMSFKVSNERNNYVF